MIALLEKQLEASVI